MEELRNEIDLLREEIAKLREATDIAIQIHNEDEREKEDLRNALTAALLRAQGAEKALGNMRAERDKLQVQINGIVQ